MDSNQLIALNPLHEGSGARGLAQLDADLLTVDVESFYIGGLNSNSIMAYIIQDDGTVLSSFLNHIPGGYSASFKTTGRVRAIAVVGVWNRKQTLLLLGSPMGEQVDALEIKAIVPGFYNDPRYTARSVPTLMPDRITQKGSTGMQREIDEASMQGMIHRSLTANFDRVLSAREAEFQKSGAIVNKTNRMPLIGDAAPSFRAKTTQGDISFPEDYRGKWVILFSHPADFTPVCTTEFMTFAKMYNEFRALNVELIGLSIDSIYAHIAWLRTIKEKIKYKGMENMEVTFPLIEDICMEVANKFGMIQPNASNTQAVRAVFFIDPAAKIRCILYYPMSIGRNFDEIKRIIQALQKTDAEGVATPADWSPGEDVIIPPAGSCGTAKDRMESVTNNKYCLDWFMCFKREKKRELSLRG